MTYLQIAELIISVGWPMAEKIIDKINNGGGDEPVTAEEWSELKSRVKSWEYFQGPKEIG